MGTENSTYCHPTVVAKFPPAPRKQGFISRGREPTARGRSLGAVNPIAVPASPRCTGGSVESGHLACCPGRSLRFRLLRGHMEDPPRGRCFGGRPKLTGNRSVPGVALRKEAEGQGR